jgi:putative FmdB family regulatory protein
MPIFDYRCEACGHTFDVLQKAGEGVLRKCPECGKLKLKKLLAAPNFHLKGGGWYKTDFRDQSNKKPGGKEAPGKEADKSSDSQSSDNKASDSKSPDDKSPGKADGEKKGHTLDSAKEHKHDHGHSHGPGGHTHSHGSGGHKH